MSLPLKRGDNVTVHRNLHNGLWSVTDRRKGSNTYGKVVDTVPCAMLRNVRMLTPRKFETIAKIRKSNRRRVVARCGGEWCGGTAPNLSKPVRFDYNPHKSQYFYIVKNGKPSGIITACAVAIFTRSGRAYAARISTQ